jgi:hypothetical protein
MVWCICPLCAANHAPVFHPHPRAPARDHPERENEKHPGGLPRGEEVTDVVAQQQSQRQQAEQPIS